MAIHITIENVDPDLLDSLQEIVDNPATSPEEVAKQLSELATATLAVHTFADGVLSVLREIAAAGPFTKST